MLTPPFHFGIVACPLSSTPSTSSEILYRGAVPAKRNFAHLDRLRIKTILYLRSAPLDEDDSLAVWGSSKSCRMVWVKADEMTEEKVGIGKNEMGEVIKTILDPSVYPLYIADINGTSHTTLVVACLRKLQGWHIDSIIGEICRFEPEYEDYSMVPFITSYLNGSEASFNIPPPPYPSWLWPQNPSPLALTRTVTRERAPSASTTTTTPALLPFPHPLSIRKHPTMKITFPPGIGNILQSPLSPSLNANNNALARVPTRLDKPTGEENRPVPAVAGYGLGIDNKVNSGISGLSGNKTMDPDDIARTGEAISAVQSAPAGNLDLYREMTMSTDRSYVEGESSESDAAVTTPGVDEDEEEEYEEDEEEEEEDDEDLPPTSQYISALDLAGFG